MWGGAGRGKIGGGGGKNRQAPLSLQTPISSHENASLHRDAMMAHNFIFNSSDDQRASKQVSKPERGREGGRGERKREREMLKRILSA